MFPWGNVCCSKALKYTYNNSIEQLLAFKSSMKAFWLDIFQRRKSFESLWCIWSKKVNLYNNLGSEFHTHKIIYIVSNMSFNVSCFVVKQHQILITLHDRNCQTCTNSHRVDQYYSDDPIKNPNPSFGSRLFSFPAFSIVMTGLYIITIVIQNDPISRHVTLFNYRDCIPK